MTNQWKFTEVPRIEELSFNKVLEKFYDYGIEGLVRENIQNSLDGKLPDSEQAVVVRIETGKLSQECIPGIDDIKARIGVLNARNEYTKETIAHMQKETQSEEIFFISFEDSNTKGLTGAMCGQSDNPEDTWSAYAYNKGVHHIEKNDDLEKARGGSHGIGKIASNAASDLYVMYFANCDAEGNQHLGGTVQLIEHAYNGRSYRSTGYFTDIQEERFYPYLNCFPEVFKKTTRGLKIIIPYFRKQFNNDRAILKSVCDNFFLAILKNKLIVEINGMLIDNETIKRYIQDPRYYLQIIEENKKEFTPLYLDTYLNRDKIEICIKDARQEYYFDLHFNYDKRIQKGRVGIIRTIGMKIEDKKIAGNANRPFNAVLIPKTVVEDSFLKSLENESHTELSWQHFKDQNSQRNAKKFIRNLSQVISEIIEKYIRENNPTDGLMNTKDVLYDVETKFKKDLNDSVSSVKIGSGHGKRTVIKVKTKTNKGPQKGSDPTKSKAPGTRKVKKETGKGESKEYFNVRPNLVRRALINQQETLSIDLSNEKHLENTSMCNIHFAIIDGMGKEYMNQFSFNENYKTVTSTLTKKELNVTNNYLEDVPIVNKQIDLKLDLHSNFNRTLKFSYYLEV